MRTKIVRFWAAKYKRTRLCETMRRTVSFARRSRPMPSPPTPASTSARAIQLRRSPIHGNGVFAVRTIAKGERIVRYAGLLRTHAETDAVYANVPETGHTFLFTLNDDYVIDGNVNGNIARWINHSCEPNCEALIEEDRNGRAHRDQVFIYALRAIAPGEELTFNYGIVLAERHTPKLKALWGCRCGARACSGTMLQRKR